MASPADSRIGALAQAIVELDGTPKMMAILRDVREMLNRHEPNGVELVTVAGWILKMLQDHQHLPMAISIGAIAALDANCEVVMCDPAGQET